MSSLTCRGLKKELEIRKSVHQRIAEALREVGHRARDAVTVAWCLMPFSLIICAGWWVQMKRRLKALHLTDEEKKEFESYPNNLDELDRLIEAANVRDATAWPCRAVPCRACCLPLSADDVRVAGCSCGFGPLSRTTVTSRTSSLLRRAWRTSQGGWRLHLARRRSSRRTCGSARCAAVVIAHAPCPAHAACC